MLINNLSKLNNSVTQSMQPSATTELNLGSMFLENVEKSVDSDFSSPPQSPFTIELTDERADSPKPVVSKVSAIQNY